MEKLKLKTNDLTEENITKLSKLFPEILTEVEKDGKLIKTINADKLKEIVGDYATNDEEVYELTWAGKQKSKQKIVTPITKTLRPIKEESVDWEKTENLFIEGDNFEVLKVLQESYLNKIKMVYIDPPYNTGNDFIYKDDFKSSKEEYNEESGAVDEEGNKLFKNTTTNGRFHSDWLSMMYERLVIARDILRDDGVIFISIDDNEVANLRKVCDDVFGESNFITNMIWQKKTSPQNDAKIISANHDYILVYAKSIIDYKYILLPRTKEQLARFKNPDNDPRGAWTAGDLSSKTKAKGHSYEVKSPIGKVFFPPKGRQWAPSLDTFKRLIEEKRIYFGKDNDSAPKIKQFLNEIQQGVVPMSMILASQVGSNTNAIREVRSLDLVFDSPKPTTLIEHLIKITCKKNDIILDFFSGSATTAHAVMQLNAEDGGNRKFIMVQLPEETDKNSEAYKAGYKTIADIGKERIRRASKKIQDKLKEMHKNKVLGTDNSESKQEKLDENSADPSKLDFGFRVFKLDESNMKDVYYNPSAINQKTLINFKDNIKEDRSEEDLLFQVLLDLAVPISARITEEKINNKRVFKVNDNFLIACFDENIDLELIKRIAEDKPLRLVFRDSSFKDDATKVNCDEYLKNKLPNAIIKVV